jgi:hypothetical protein
MDRSVLEHQRGVSRDCSRKQRIQSTFEVELCVVDQAMPTVDPIAKLVAIAQSKRRIVWRTFVIAQPARIRLIHTKTLSLSL